MDESENPLQALFAEALEISDASQRAAFLNRACGPDAHLRREVEELLQAEADVGKFLPDQPAATPSGSALQELAEAPDPFDALPSAAATEQPGDRIGRYELVEKLGEGGCGVVYLARQETPVRRQVALKVIKLGMDTRQVIARFEAERQALAMMDHPNIAKVFDAGATDAQHSTFNAQLPSGRPYFVMELVRGSKITDYCAQHQLSTRERLELFIQICQAVQHAHQKGIIHRDLKPSNILVAVNDGVAVPKVIDFGIAKATEGKLTDQTLFTAFEQFLGTPAYMSPEQAAMTNLDIDTRSDIYSLGVLLYELLTGTTPFDTKELLALGVDELRRTIREKAPVRPSTRLRQTTLASLPSPPVTRHSPLATDLDWIVMKCLEKDRARRYETANALAADLRRHLNNEPVIARPPSRLYEFQKTVRRHKVGFAATAAVIVVLVLGVVATSWQAIRATRLRQQADAESYTSDMNVVLQAWDEGNLRRATSLLRAHIPQPGQPDLRGFEWRYLWNLCQDESLHTVRFTNDPVRKLAATPAHSFVAAACKKTIRLLEPSTGRELARFPYPNPEAANAWPSVALAAGMTNLLAAHRAEGVIALWDVASRKQLLTFQPFTDNVAVMALSPDGNYLAVADQNALGFYGTVLEVWGIALPSQQPTLAWSYSITNGVTAMSFSPNGNELVASWHTDSEIIINSWEAKTGRELKRISDAAAYRIQALAFSPDGTLLASAGNEATIKIWNFTERTSRNNFEGHLSAVVSLAFTPDGTQLISSGYDGTIRRWDIRSRKESGMWRVPQRDELNAVVAPDGKSVVSATWDEMKIWNVEPRQPARVLNVPKGVSFMIVSPDNQSLILSNPTDTERTQDATVWDIATGRHKFDLVCKGMIAKSLAFSPDGRLFAIGSVGKEGLVGLWETAGWQKGASRIEPFRYLTNGFESASICFSRDGKILAAAGLSFPPNTPKEPSGATNRLAFWEVGTWKRLNLLPKAGVGTTEWLAAATVDFSPDGRLVAVGYRDGWVRLWDLKQERLLKEFKEHKAVPRGVVVTFSSDNRWLASYSQLGPSLVLFDLADHEDPHAVPLSLDESARIHWALFAPDNKSLITADDSGLIKFWNLRTRGVALTLRYGPGPGGYLAMAPDGNALVSKDVFGVIKVWSAPSLAEIDRGLKAR